MDQLVGVLMYPVSATREVLTFSTIHDGIPDEMEISVDIGNTGTTAWAPGVTLAVICLEGSFCGNIKQVQTAR